MHSRYLREDKARELPTFMKDLTGDWSTVRLALGPVSEEAQGMVSGPVKGVLITRTDEQTEWCVMSLETARLSLGDCEPAQIQRG